MTAEISYNAAALVALMKLKGVGRRSALRIMGNARVGDDAEQFQNAVVGCAERSGLSGDAVASAWDAAISEMTQGLEDGVAAFSIHDESYPERLRRIGDPPAVLFVKGEVDQIRSDRAIAIIGTREPTSYGRKVARKSAVAAVDAGFAIVSGLAHGCDTYAHEGCLEAGGVGIAVLAHGLDRVYPAANRGLAERLLETGGCLVSEYPIGYAPMRTSFAERDRIQSGLSDGILVIETGIKGGTLHTVRFAGEQNRKIACIAHPEAFADEEKTLGNQMLIKEGRATPISDGKALEAYLQGMCTLAEPSAVGVEVKLSPSAKQIAWDF